MAALPQQLTYEMLQQRWASMINPFISNPVLNATLLKDVKLASGANIIDHRLGRKLQGWYPVRIRASATFFDTQDANQTPELTLNLTASAAVTIDLVVF